MHQKIFQSKVLAISVIFLFIILISSDVLPQRSVSAVNDTGKLIQEGKELYKKGEYEEAIKKFLEAKDSARTKEELSEVYFNISLAYYSDSQSVKAKEYLQKSLEILPERTIDALYHPPLYHPPGFVKLFNQMKKEFIKPEAKEKRPVVKEKPLAEKKVKKKRNLGLILALGGAAVGVILLICPWCKNKKYGNIQVNSTPTGARVHLDGSDTGKTTNCTLKDIKPGSHTVKLVKEGYQDYQESVSVTAGQTSSVDATLTAHTITVTDPTSSTIWTKGEKVDITWETDESSRSVGNMSAGSGLNPLSSGSSVASSYQRRRAIRYRRSFLEVRRVRSGLESMGLWQDKEIGVSKLSRIKGVSKKSSSSFKEVESVPQRGIDIEKVSKDMRFERNNFPRVHRDSFQRTISLSKMNILTITNVKIELYKGGSLVATITSSTDNDGSYSWTVDESFTEGSDYKVRISCVSEPGIYGESDYFKIEEGFVQVTTHSAEDSNPSLIWAKGKYWVAFNSQRTGNEDIYITSSADGINWSSPLRVTSSNIEEGAPSIICDNNGKLWIAYHYRPGPSSSRIYLISSSDGINWSSPRQVAGDLQESHDPSMIQDSNGIYWIAFDAVYPNELYISKSTDTLSWSSPVRITPSGGTVDRAPSFIQDNAGKYYITYSAEPNLTDRDLYIISSYDGISWSSPLPLVVDSSIVNTQPSLIQDSRGKFYVAFNNCDIGNSTIRLSYIYSEDGVNWSSPEDIISGANNNYIAPCLSLKSSNEIYLAFSSDKEGNYDIYFMNFER